jgi:hypothetical protein
MDWYYMSPRAQKAANEGAANDHVHRGRHERMQAGPFLAEDDCTLIVPSDWYNVQAAVFWASHGFQYKSGRKEWHRDTQKPYNAKTYTAEAWLESTRREFYGYWPELLGDQTCPKCGNDYHTINEYQTMCAPCAAVIQAERKAHDQDQ